MKKIYFFIFGLLLFNSYIHLNEERIKPEEIPEAPKEILECKFGEKKCCAPLEWAGKDNCYCVDKDKNCPEYNWMKNK